MYLKNKTITCTITLFQPIISHDTMRIVFFIEIVVKDKEWCMSMVMISQAIKDIRSKMDSFFAPNLP